VALLHFVDHPGDTAAAYHVAISPFGPHVALQAPFEPGALPAVHAQLRRRLEREGYAGFFANLLRACAGDMDAQGCERFEQFLTLAEEVDAQPTLRATHLVELAETRKVEAAGAGAARVMTIHGSKGLEFDIVILPELDAPWQLLNDAVLTHRPTLDSPVTEATRYANSVLRSCEPGLERLHRHCLDREVLEELCCLYVAMTRAKRHLEMIVPPGKPRGTTAASVLMSTLAGDKDWEENCVFYQRAHGDWIGQLNEAAAAPADEAEPACEERPIVLAEASAASAARWQRRSPSSLEGGQRVSLLDVLGAGSGAAKERGTLLHAWCEMIDWLDDGEPTDDELLAAAAREGFAPADVVADLAAFRAALKEPAIQQVFSRSAYAERLEAGDALRVLSERAFAVRDVDPQRDEPVLLTGRFDRVVLCERDGRAAWAEIVDFKTDSVGPADGAAFDERLAHYTPQMRAYQRAAAKVWRLPPERITARLAFLGAAAVVEV
jgi:ATP-dependent exoDNAse (exonuclease V) beta subunit